MEKAMLITIVTSAAVGALASSVLSLAGQWLERRARRKELLLSKAIDLAFARRDFVMKTAEREGVSALLRDDAAMAAEYYRVLEQVMDKGTLPDFFTERDTKSRERLDSGS